MKYAIENFKKMGLSPVIYRQASSVLEGKGLHPIGFYGANPNKQYDYDHKDDLGLVWDKKYQMRKLECLKAAYEEYTELAYEHAGPAVIETFGENQRPSWVFYTEPEKIDLCMNFYNPICHSSIMYRKDFVYKHFINYNLACKCAQDYDFYKQILFAGGKLANIDEILVRYRMHANRLTDIRDSQQIQIDIAEKVKKALQLRFLSEEEHKKISDLMADFPYNDYSLDNVILAISMIEKTNFYSQKLVQSLVQDIKNNLFKF